MWINRKPAKCPTLSTLLPVPPREIDFYGLTGTRVARGGHSHENTSPMLPKSSKP
jgi:hypothetical protein